MNVIFSEFAMRELDDASLYYELEYAGIGERFREEVKKAVLRIAEYPQAWSIVRGDVRRCLLHGFPYSLLCSSKVNVI